ncbi:MAG: hypothetical protein Q9182_006118 [Xanthomendoza sp. 2 TL-2023]
MPSSSRPEASSGRTSTMLSAQGSSNGSRHPASSRSHHSSAHPEPSNSRHSSSRRPSETSHTGVERTTKRHTALAPIAEGSVSTQRGSHTDHNSRAPPRRSVSSSSSSRTHRASATELSDQLGSLSIAGRRDSRHGTAQSSRSTWQDDSSTLLPPSNRQQQRHGESCTRTETSTRGATSTRDRSSSTRGGDSILDAYSRYSTLDSSYSSTLDPHPYPRRTSRSTDLHFAREKISSAKLDLAVAKAEMSLIKAGFRLPRE